MVRKKSNAIHLMVSSTVYGSESFLTQIYATLTGFGYRVSMSHAGTVFANPQKSNFENCIAAVESCDAFLGIINGRYGSGREAEGLSITHLEMRRAVEMRKPRWFLVHHDVLVARVLLGQFRFKRDGKTKKKLAFQPTQVLDDIQVLDLYDEVVQMDIPLASRTGNWAQHYYTETDALRFIDAQFADPQRIHDILNTQP